MPRLELFKDKSVWKYGFSLTAHEVTIQFLASTKDEANRWCEKLRRNAEVTLLHISKHFSVGAMIQRGSYSKTQIAADEAGAQCTIKSVSKAHLFDNQHRMVTSLPVLWRGRRAL